MPSSDTLRLLEEWGRLPQHLLSKGVVMCLILLLPQYCLLRVMVLVAQRCEPKCTEVGMVTTNQLMHSLDKDAFVNIKLLKSEKLPVQETEWQGFVSNLRSRSLISISHILHGPSSAVVKHNS